MKIGILAVQGDILEHIIIARRALENMGVKGDIVAVKMLEDLNGLNALIIPGGESTTIGSLMERKGLLTPLRKAIEEGLPVLGTCAGAILLAKRVKDKVLGEVKQPILGVMSIEVLRNAFGRQRESFELELEVEGLGRKVKGVFIRAPAITELWGKARSLAQINSDMGSLTVLAVEDNMIASSFHPELVGETFLHEMLIDKALR